MRLRLRDGQLGLRPGRPLLMGIVNAAPDSFSDPAERSPEALVEHAHELVEAGAALIDVGGESGRTDREAVTAEDEIARVVPVVESLAGSGIVVSVDTWRAPVARAVLDAGAAMVNDVSGLSDPALAEACARTGAAMVITHTRVKPKRKAFPAYDDVVADALRLWSRRAADALELGVGGDQLVFDPGVDLGKTPAQSVELLRRLPELRQAGPLLLAVSRKDFIGALTGRAPAGREAGTLAALEACVAGGASIVRLHDVAGAADYLRVRAAVRGDEQVPKDLHLDEALRREPAA